RPRGRGRRTEPTAVRARALELGLSTREMSKANYAEVVGEIRALAPDVVVVVAFGIILKRDLLDLPPLGCVNVHASLLPRHRGVSPIQAAILAGDKVSGCTTMRIDEQVDTGGILLVEETPIAPDETAGSLSDRLARVGAHLLVRTLDGIADGTITPVAQDPSRATKTLKLRKGDGEIDWSLDCASLDRRIRAMTPWPSAFTFHTGRRVIVVEASPLTDAAGEPGRIVSLEPLRVACGEGAVEIHRLKPEGGKVMPPAAYLAGHAARVGDRWGR
ncbi:MAG: methionyl-tRNA formyltransferase, partial [Candidatus Krumholzibacteria bacterium]|nr:methionyl-tRNA formyltransferase [Candidatus Krumholzibacteria bacterium]